jgi:hypothetical protein
MKFTSEMLMKAMGLQVGDRVKVVICDNDDKNLIFVITKDEVCGGITLLETNDGFFTDLEYLLDQDFEILPKPKRVGELKCLGYSCAKCPLRMINCTDAYSEITPDSTLYEILEYQNEENPDQEIYDLLKARLDKEVEE